MVFQKKEERKKNPQVWVRRECVRNWRHQVNGGENVCVRSVCVCVCMKTRKKEKSNSRVRLFPILYRLREYMWKIYLAIFQERTRKYHTRIHMDLFLHLASIAMNERWSEWWAWAREWTSEVEKEAEQKKKTHTNPSAFRRTLKRWKLNTMHRFFFSIKLNAIGNVHGRNACSKTDYE